MEEKGKKIKICQVSATDLTVRFLLLEDIQFLKREGFEVSAVCSEGKWVEEIRKKGIEVKTIKIKRKITPFSDLITLFKLFFYFKKQDFDIIHTHTPKAALLGQIAARIAGVPIIINTIHGYYFTENTPTPKRKLFILVEKFIALFSDLIFFRSREDIETTVKKKIAPSNKIRFLVNGIDLEKFNPDRFSSDFIEKKKQELNLNPNMKIIGIVARLIKEKGFLDLFEAFGKVIEKFPQTLLLVVGPEDPEKKDSFSYSIVKDWGIENNVKFLGLRKDLDEIYPLMDVFVLPSYREGFPTVVLEASATGKPVVATNIRGCREAIDDGKTGILVPMRNPEELAKAIIYLLENPETAKTLGENGRKKAEKEFDENQIFSKIKEGYQRLIKEKMNKNKPHIPSFEAKKEKIKVCHIASVDLTLRFLLLRQMQFLKREGFEVSAVCSRGAQIKEIEDEGIKLEPIQIKRKISPLSDLITLFKLIFYFEEEKFDIVHTHTPKASLLGQLAAKIAGVPIIINTIHGFYFTETTPFLKSKFFIFIEKIVVLFSDLIFFQSREDIETSQKEKIGNNSKNRFLGNGINLRTFNPQRFSLEFIEKKKKNLGLDPEIKIIGAVGRLVKEKGYLELFEAFQKVLEKFPQTQLLIVGPTDSEKKDSFKPSIVKNYGIENNVKFLGLRKDLDEIYPLMDIFVLPSWREGFPRSVLEASAMEKPVIATDIRGCREAVQDNKTGILIPVKNPEKLAEIIIYLLENPETAKKIGQEGRKKALQEFDENQIFEKIKKEYQQLIEEKL